MLRHNSTSNYRIHIIIKDINQRMIIWVFTDINEYPNTWKELVIWKDELTNYWGLSYWPLRHYIVFQSLVKKKKSGAFFLPAITNIQLFSSLFFIDLSTYLKGRWQREGEEVEGREGKRERGREKERESSIRWLIPQMLATVGDGQFHQPGTPPSCKNGWHGSKY